MSGDERWKPAGRETGGQPVENGDDVGGKLWNDKAEWTNAAATRQPLWDRLDDRPAEPTEIDRKALFKRKQSTPHNFRFFDDTDTDSPLVKVKILPSTPSENGSSSKA